jgi:hypothetical protein
MVCPGLAQRLMVDCMYVSIACHLERAFKSFGALYVHGEGMRLDRGDTKALAVASAMY